jgi:hypothetical protein
MADADFSAAQAAEVLFRPIRARAVKRVRFLMVDHTAVWHGNQHVRMRRAQVSNFATTCPAPEASPHFVRPFLQPRRALAFAAKLPVVRPAKNEKIQTSEQPAPFYRTEKLGAERKAFL